VIAASSLSPEACGCAVHGHYIARIADGKITELTLQVSTRKAT
jgi:hypothetical protein